MVDSILPRWRTMPGILQQALDIVRAERRDRLGVETGEGLAEILPLAQDRQPAQPRLEAFQADFFEQTPVVGDRAAPFAVVIGSVYSVIGAAPPAPPDTVGPVYQTVVDSYRSS